DIVSAFAGRRSSVLTESVDTSMTSPVVSCAPEKLLADAMATMTTKRFRHMPVVEAGKLVGILSIGDLVKHHLYELEQETSSLRAYIATA
ncbi:MAG: CBS domain-containing protein, partial [Pseudomonadota bacterium]|nr:CBS domain-containing protein [Pseudomonadota bacterium]